MTRSFLEEERIDAILSQERGVRFSEIVQFHTVNAGVPAGAKEHTCDRVDSSHWNGRGEPLRLNSI
jgi:hypothetical protein